MEYTKKEPQFILLKSFLKDVQQYSKTLQQNLAYYPETWMDLRQFFSVETEVAVFHTFVKQPKLVSVIQSCKHILDMKQLKYIKLEIKARRFRIRGRVKKYDCRRCTRIFKVCSCHCANVYVVVVKE